MPGERGDGAEAVERFTAWEGLSRYDGKGPRGRKKGAPDLQPGRKRGPQSYNCEQLGSANKLSELESLRAPRQEPDPADFGLERPSAEGPPNPCPPRPPQASMVIC